MKSNAGLMVMLILSLALAGCAPATEEIATDASARMQADVEALRTLGGQVLAATNAGDIEAWLSFFADDVVLMPPGEPGIAGKEAVRSWAQPLFDKFSYEENWASDGPHVFGDWAFESGSYTMTATPKDGSEPIHEEGKYIWICRRLADGTWKYAKMIWNTDRPAPAPAE